MDRRSLIGRSPTSDDNDGARHFVYDNQTLGKFREPRTLSGLELSSIGLARTNSFSVDSGLGDHERQYKGPLHLKSRYPVPGTRIDQHAYTNPVFEDDYNDTGGPMVSANDEKYRTLPRNDGKYRTSPRHDEKFRTLPRNDGSVGRGVGDGRVRGDRSAQRRDSVRSHGGIDRSPGVGRNNVTPHRKQDNFRSEQTIPYNNTPRSRDKYLDDDWSRRRDAGRFRSPVSRDPPTSRDHDRPRDYSRSRDAVVGDDNRSRRGHGRHDDVSRHASDQSDHSAAAGRKVKRQRSKSEERGRVRRKSRDNVRKSRRSLERTFGRLGGGNNHYNQLESEADSDYQNGDYRSDNSSNPPLPQSRDAASRDVPRDAVSRDTVPRDTGPRDTVPRDKSRDQLTVGPKRQPSITSSFAQRARVFLNKRIADSTSTRPSDTDIVDITDTDSVFAYDDISISADSATWRRQSEPIALEPIILMESAVDVRSTPTYRPYDGDVHVDIANGTMTSPTTSPTPSDIDEEIPRVMTSEDTDDMIVMLLSNRSPCVAKLIMFCGIMQMISGFITMVSGASGFLSDITVFNFKFQSPIAFWCGALFVFSGALACKTSHTKRKSMNLFTFCISFTAFCAAVFVLVMTADPRPIHDCNWERRILYYSHLFLMNVQIMSSLAAAFMCCKSVLQRPSSSPSEVQVLKTLSRYGLKPEHSVPQMAAAQLAAANQPSATKPHGGHDSHWQKALTRSKSSPGRKPDISSVAAAAAAREANSSVGSSTPKQSAANHRTVKPAAANHSTVKPAATNENGPRSNQTKITDSQRPADTNKRPSGLANGKATHVT